MRDWCARISQQTGQRWEYTRVNQAAFEAHKPHTLVEAAQHKWPGKREHDTLGNLPPMWCMDRAPHGIPSAYRLLGHARPQGKPSRT